MFLGIASQTVAPKTKVQKQSGREMTDGLVTGRWNHFDYKFVNLFFFIGSVKLKYVSYFNIYCQVMANIKKVDFLAGVFYYTLLFLLFF